MEMKRATILTVAKMLNATKDEKGKNVAIKVPIVAVGTKELTEKFLAACESVSPENEGLLPDQVCDVYNVLVSTVEEAKEEKVEEKEAPPPMQMKEVKGGRQTAKSTPAQKAVERAKPSLVLKEYLFSLIASGQYDTKTIIEKAVQKFPEKSRGAVSTYISDGKNTKYNKFSKLIIVFKDGKLSFAD